MSEELDRPACDLPARPALSVPVEIFYFDTDAGGVVHNVAYLRLVEVARSKLAAHLGWPLARMEATGIVPVVARTEIDYLAPARLGDELVIEAKLLRLERVRFLLGFEMIRAGDGQHLMHCRQTMAVVNLNTMRPHRLPAAWKERYG
ncbi:MAG: thioesterase family protein [Verrucomicrobiota bacterium]